MNNLHIGGNMNNNEDKGDSMKDITKLDVYGVMAISITLYSFILYLMTSSKPKNDTSDCNKEANNL